MQQNHKELIIEYFTKSNKEYLAASIDKFEPYIKLDKLKTHKSANGLVFPINGCAKFTLADKSYLVKPGIVLNAGPDLDFSLETIGDKPCRCIVIHYEISNKEKMGNLCRKNNFTIDMGVCANVHCKMDKLIQSERKIEHYDIFQAKNLFNELIDEIINNLKHDGKYSCDEISKEDFETLKEAIDYIDNNYDLFLPVESVAEKFGMGARKFGQLFKAYTGVNVIVYIRRLKLNRAKHLLRYSNSTITDIAYSLGYRDHFYFSRVFKEEIGVSPTQFRNRYMKRI